MQEYFYFFENEIYDEVPLEFSYFTYFDWER